MYRCAVPTEQGIRHADKQGARTALFFQLERCFPSAQLAVPHRHVAACGGWPARAHTRRPRHTPHPTPTPHIPPRPHTHTARLALRTSFRSDRCVVVGPRVSWLCLVCVCRAWRVRVVLVVRPRARRRSVSHCSLASSSLVCASLSSARSYARYLRPLLPELCEP